MPGYRSVRRLLFNSATLSRQLRHCRRYTPLSRLLLSNIIKIVCLLLLLSHIDYCLWAVLMPFRSTGFSLHCFTTFTRYWPSPPSAALPVTNNITPNTLFNITGIFAGLRFCHSFCRASFRHAFMSSSYAATSSVAINFRH